jgi:hypothetical protein
MFQIFDNQGFQITLGNGVTCSVMFGNGHFCSNRSVMETNRKSMNAEVAFFRGDESVTSEVYRKTFYGGQLNDEVIGYCEPWELVKLLNVAATLESSENIVAVDKG